MVRALYYVAGLAMAALGAAAPSSVAPRADVPSIPHNEVKGFEEKALEVVLKFKPFLKVSSGCVPWPAVNDKGEVRYAPSPSLLSNIWHYESVTDTNFSLNSKGLKNTGSPSGECGSNKGQVYTRAKVFPNSLAIMYAWYMPKDQPAHSATGSGHRHEWENAVVWLSDNSDNAKFLGVAWSKHGGYGHAKADDLSDDKLSDGHPLIEYFTNGFTNHELKSSTIKGGTQPAIHWPDLPQKSRDALNKADFGDANVPFKDDNFENNLKKASL